MTKEMKRLRIEFTIFAAFLITAFGVIVVTEKMYPMMTDKVDKKLTKYINETYKDKENINDFVLEKTEYKETYFQKKVKNSTNKHLYFTIKYKNKKIKDDYKENYYEGKSFLKYIANKINKNINNKTNKKTKVTINKKYNEFNNQIKDRLLKEENLLSLSIYNLEIEINSKLTEKEILNSIVKTNTYYENNNIIPDSYNITIIDEKDITKYIKINNLKPGVIKNDNFKVVIHDIISNEKSDILESNKITFENNI